MLILVLVLVAIALAFWIAGWFLQVVALFWTSVGICLLAGIVLFYDWWQTRSAERAGDRGQGAVGAPDEARDRFGQDARYGADMEPATQVLPAVRPQGTGGPGAGPAQDPHASDATVQMPVVRPSGSPEEPSGVSRSVGSASPSVTDGAGSDGARAAGVTSSGVGREGVPDGVGRGGDPDRSGQPSEPAAPGADGPRASGAAGSPGAVLGAAGSGVAAAGVAGAAGATGTDRPAGGGDAVNDDRPADRGNGTGHEQVAFGAGPATGVPGPPNAPATEANTTAARAATGDPSDPGESSAVPAGAATGTARGTVPDRQQAGPDQQPAPDGEAPEEPRDPTVAALVARLPDEVLVIDEHPRYHVPACRTLSGRAVIPLPVSEAVELGFTPCAWCSPNRTLGERHGAQAR